MKSKRILALMLALVMALSLAACGGSKQEETPADNAGNGEAAGDTLRISAALSWLLLPGAGPRPVSRPWPPTLSPSTTAPSWWTPPAATVTVSIS